MADVTVSIPDGLLARIDAARTTGESRSAFLAAAATRQLDHVRRVEKVDAIARAREAIVDWPVLDPAAVIRAERDAR